LHDIENQARQKAKSVLTQEQTNRLGVVPDKPVAVMGACAGGVMSNVEQMLQKLMSGQGAAPQTGPKPK
jgi:surfactin synthase thioesterase subunit